jgi:hypothetical protein
MARFNFFLSKILFITTLALLFTCENTLLLDIEEDIIVASLIDTPTLSGVAITNETTPTWYWNPVADADFYRYGFTEGVWIGTSSSNLTYTPALALAEGSHTLFVQAGKDSEIWSDSAVFTIEIDLTPPATPVVTGQSPTNDTTPVWNWNAVPDAVSYRYGLIEFTWISENVVITSYTQPSVLPEGDHTLYVQAQDAAGNWSDSGSTMITVDLTALPSPILEGPSVSNTHYPTWDWNDGVDGIKYRYGFTDLTWMTETATLSEYTSTNSLSDGPHTLYVQVCNSLGNWSASSALIITVDTTPPDPPAISGPVTTTSSKPTWTWNIPADTNSFRYQLDGESAGSWNVVATSITSYQPDDLEKLSEGSYTLYVQTADNLENWSVSDSHTITVSINPPATPDPANSSVLLDLTPLLDWEILEYAGDYRIQINDSNDFSDTVMVDDSSVGLSGYQVSVSDGLVPGGTYYWHIQVMNTDGIWSDSWSSVWSFSIPDFWAQTIGGSTVDVIYSVTETSDGGLICTGYSDSFSADNNFLVIKMGIMGDIEWQNIYGLSTNDYALVVQETFDAEGSTGYIIGGSAIVSVWNHPWIIKLSLTGSIEWEYTFGSGTAADYISSIKQTTDYGYIVSGYTPIHDLQGGWDVWILKLTSAGIVSWQKTYGGANHEEAHSIQELSGGGYIVSGETSTWGEGGLDFWILKLDSGGAILWEYAYGGSSSDEISYEIQNTSDGGFIVVGYIDFDTYGNDILVLKLDSSGSVSWAKRIGGDWDEIGREIQETSDGYIIAGHSDSLVADYDWHDFYVLKLNASGEVQWQKTYTQDNGSDGYEEKSYALSVTADGAILVGGYSKSQTDSNIDSWLLRLRSDGTCPLLGSNTSFTSSDYSVTKTETSGVISDSTAVVNSTSGNSTTSTSSAASTFQAP